MLQQFCIVFLVNSVVVNYNLQPVQPVLSTNTLGKYLVWYNLMFWVKSGKYMDTLYVLRNKLQEEINKFTLREKETRQPEGSGLVLGEILRL